MLKPSKFWANSAHLRTRPRYWWDNTVENFMTIGWAFQELSCKRPAGRLDILTNSRVYSLFWVHKNRYLLLLKTLSGVSEELGNPKRVSDSNKYPNVFYSLSLSPHTLLVLSLVPPYILGIGRPDGLQNDLRPPYMASSDQWSYADRPVYRFHICLHSLSLLFPLRLYLYTLKLFSSSSPILYSFIALENPLTTSSSESMTYFSDIITEILLPIEDTGR